MKKIFFCLCLTLTGFTAFAQQLTVAVEPFEVRGDIPRGDADTVYELFVGELAVSGSVKVVDRNSFDTTAALGTALNADWVIQGTMQKLGGRLLIIASILDIKSLKMMGVADMRVNGIDEVYDKMGDFVAQTIQTIRGGGGAVRE